jgi:phosphohistidine swiveling domain-containing protein
MTYEILEKFKNVIGDDPVFAIRATIAPFFMCVPWNTKEHPLHELFIAKGRDTLLVINEVEYFALAIDKFRQYYEGRVSIKELEEEYLAYEKHAQQLYDEVTSRDLSKLTDSELQEYMRTIVNELYPELIATIYIETVDHDKILSVIGDEHKGELDAIWEQATQATFVSFEGRYLHNVVELVSTNQVGVVRKAKFMFTDYFWSKSDAEIEVALGDVRDHLTEKTKEAEDIYTAMNERERTNVLWKESLSPESRRLVDYIQLVMRLRDIRKDPIAQMLAVMVEVATIMTERAGIEVHSAPYILLYEYAQGVEHLRNIRDDIRTREQGCIYLVNPDHSYEVSHCDFHDVITQFDAWTEHHVHDSNELKGQTACRGSVHGIVRVISDPYDDRGFQDGDVLVTSMTRPEFVPIMKRAGAVVTNEGGITCHAAIVSRELKIPCVIGTKIATQVLKDGDLVEVDANNGVVRILNKKI